MMLSFLPAIGERKYDYEKKLVIFLVPLFEVLVHLWITTASL